MCQARKARPLSSRHSPDHKDDDNDGDDGAGDDGGDVGDDDGDGAGDRPQVHDYDNHHDEQDQNDVGHNQDN